MSSSSLTGGVDAHALASMQVDAARTTHVGQKLGPYRLCLQIGAGGMATVYLARREEESGRGYGGSYVAIKCIRAHLSGKEGFVSMFADEARIASRIRHANVCNVLDFREHHGTIYIVMEYLDGETLKSMHQRIRRTPVQIAPGRHACIIARIIADAAEGLHAAHELCDAKGQPLGVVHRDVSPENLFVTYDGNVKVVDFGLVRATGREHHTRTGVVKGKYAYISPEVLESTTPDRRCDVWGLGVVLWELLTGRRLFRADNDAATLRAVATKPIPPPSALGTCPPEMDAIVLTALQRRPEHRYQDARELGRALTAFIGARSEAVGLADLADFMYAVFPNGRACHRQLLAVAEQVEEASVALEVGGGHADAPRHPVRAVAASTTTSRARPAGDVREDGFSVGTGPEHGFPAWARPNRLGSGMIGAGLALGAAMAFSFGTRDAPEPSRAIVPASGSSSIERADGDGSGTHAPTRERSSDGPVCLPADPRESDYSVEVIEALPTDDDDELVMRVRLVPKR